jgi:outer membrane protein OmpA-like peptidoglycan-associated protein
LDAALVPADNQTIRQISKPLVFAFIVVVVLWLGVVAVFFLNRQQMSIAHQATGRIQQSEVPAAPEKPPVLATETISIIESKEASPVEANVPQEAQEQMQSRMANDSDSTNASDTLPTILEIPDEIAVEDPEDQPLPPAVESAETTAAAEPSITLMDIRDAFGVYPEIPFAFNSNTFDSESQDKLALIARYCLENPDVALVLWGYTDQSGAQSYNIKLAEFRSDVVKYYLMGQGVSADAITTRAIGPDTEGPGGTTVPIGGLRRKVVIEIIPPPGA